MKTTEENLIEKDTYLKERRIARAEINAPLYLNQEKFNFRKFKYIF